MLRRRSVDAVSLPRPGGLPIKTHVVMLCLAVAVPLLLMSVYLLSQAALAERQRLETEARSESRDAALLVGRWLSGRVATLQTLASTQELQNGNLAGFYQRAGQLTQSQGGFSVALRDLDGRMLLNTGAPYGSPLPAAQGSARETDQRLVDTGHPQISDMFLGPVSKTFMFIVEVPVMRDGRIVYLLSLGVPLSELGRILDEKVLRPDWWASLIDGNGRIVARTRVSEQVIIGTTVGPAARRGIGLANPEHSLYLTSQDGIDNFTVFRRVEGTRWTVGVTVPQSVLLRPMLKTLGWVLALVGVALGASTVLAYLYGRHITHAVTALTEAARALGRGETVPMIKPSALEIDEAGISLLAAERELSRRAAEREKTLKTLGLSNTVVRELDGEVLFWGRGAEKLYGYSVQEAKGCDLHELLGTEFPMSRAEIEAELFATGTWEGELRQVSRSGETLIVASSWALRRGRADDGVVTVVEASADLTAKTRAERQLAIAKAEAEAANKAKSSLLATVTHDMRQPFQAMRLFHQMLEAKATPEQARLVEIMGKALASGEELLDALADYSGLDAGKMTLRVDRFPLDALLADVVEECRPMATEAGLDLRRVPVAGVMMETDRTLLKRMVRNLLVNAIRYTQEGSVLVGCRRRGPRVWIQVADTGVGIPEDKLVQIFDEFYRAAEQPRSGARGLGLGLAIVARVSQVLGFPILVASAEGRGSVFTIDAAPAPPEAARPDPGAAPA